MADQRGNVLIVAETSGGEARSTSLELFTVGRELADQLSSSLVAVVLGHNVGAAVASVTELGADRVLVVDDARLAQFTVEGVARAVEAAIAATAPVLVVLPGTTSGRDLAPYLAAKRRTAALVDLAQVRISGDNIVARRPVYQGKMFTEVTAKRGTMAFLTISSGAYAPPRTGTGTLIEPEPLEVSGDDDNRVKVVDLVEAGGGPSNLEGAEAVVVGGRGLGDADKFQMIEDLASVLDAAVGATRAVTDLGWRPHYEQVGQTGKTISPRLYIGIGVSGAVQHTVGMRGSETIVAINRDPDAPIFKLADFGIVGDMFEIVPPLVARLRELRGR